MKELSGKERGFLLLSSKLGVPERKNLTVAQMRMLTKRVGAARRDDGSRELEPRDLTAVGYSEEAAQHIWSLLQEMQLLDAYLKRGARSGCTVLTRAGEKYPLAVRKRLGLDAPGCLWAKGDLSLLDTPKIALVGSRQLREENRKFARAVGIQAAKQGYTLVSGNARGADETAQQACIEAGGSVISVVADRLENQPSRERVLFLAEDSFDVPFTAQRALSRNRVIHSLAPCTFVAQAALYTGGTWNGTVKNLQHGWSHVFCFDDASQSTEELEKLGAQRILVEELQNISLIRTQQMNFFEE